MIKKLLLATGLTIAACEPAHAQYLNRAGQQCASTPKFLEALKTEYGETPFIELVAHAKGKIYIIVNPESETFSILKQVSLTDVCMVTAGRSIRGLATTNHIQTVLENEPTKLPEPPSQEQSKPKPPERAL